MTGGRGKEAAWQWLAGAAAVLTATGLALGSGCMMASEDTSEPGAGGGPLGGGGTIPEGGAGGAGAEHGNNLPVMSDQCPAEGDRPYDLYVPSSLTLTGWTGDADDDYSSFCGGGAAGELADGVYYLQAMGRGTLTVSAASSAEQPVVYVETDCGVRTTFGLPPDQLPCLDTAGQQIRLGVVAEQDLYIIVEGRGADGDFEVKVDLFEPICGDGVINPGATEAEGEQCDFGAGGAGGAGGSGGGAALPNGCNDSCRFDTPATQEDECPGVNIDAQVGQPIYGYTVGFNDTYQPSCTPAGGPDRFYAVGLLQDEVLSVSVEADFDVVLALMTACGDLQPLHCQDLPGLSKEESFDFTAPAAGTYYIVVDGYDETSWGTFTLTATKN